MQEFKTAVETADTKKIESMLADNVVFRSSANARLKARTSSTSTRTGSSMIYA